MLFVMERILIYQNWAIIGWMRHSRRKKSNDQKIRQQRDKSYNSRTIVLYVWWGKQKKKLKGWEGKGRKGKNVKPRQICSGDNPTRASLNEKRTFPASLTPLASVFGFSGFLARRCQELYKNYQQYRISLWNLWYKQAGRLVTRLNV